MAENREVINELFPSYNGNKQLITLNASELEDFGEKLMFLLSDCEGTQRSLVGLESVLLLLKAAEENGYVPPLPDQWWIKAYIENGYEPLRWAKRKVNKENKTLSEEGDYNE